MDVRRFGEHYRSPRLHGQARARGLRDLLRHQVPQPRAPGRAAAARLARSTTGTAAHGAVLRREVRLGAGELVRGQRGGGRRGGAPARLGGRHWSPAIGAEHAACREAAALFDETSFAKIEVSGPGAAVVAGAAVRQPGGARGRARSPTRRCSTAAAGSSATSRSPGSPRTASGSSPARRSARHDLRLDPLALRRGAATCGSRTSPRAGRASGLWGPKARDVLAGAARPTDLDFPYMSLRELAVGDVPVRALRVTYVGELGWELYCPMEFGVAAVADAVGGRRAARAGGGRLPGDRLAAAREGLPRVGRRHHARRDAVRGRPRLLRASSTRATSSAARRCWPPRERGRRGGCAAWCSPTRRSVALGNEPVRVGRRDRRAGSPAAATATRVGASIAYAYLPAEHAEPGTEVAVEIFGEWVDGEVASRAAVRSRRHTSARAKVSIETMSTADTKALIEEGIANFQKRGARARRSSSS